MELEIVKFFQHLGLGVIDPYTEFVSSDFFLVTLWTVITVFIFLFDRINGKKIFLAVIIAVGLHFLITEGFFKHILTYFTGERLRPYLADPKDIIPFGVKNTDSSFPSGHMSSTLAVLSVYFYYYRKYWPLMLVFVLFMALARLHNGMHYPTDILAGAVLGILYGITAVYIAKKIINKNK